MALRIRSTCLLSTQVGFALSTRHGCASAGLIRRPRAQLMSRDPLARASLLVVDRLVDQSPEIATHSRRDGGGPGALGHQDPDHVLPRVRIPRGPQAAVPAVSS